MWLTYDDIPRKRKIRARAVTPLDALAFARTKLGFTPDAAQSEVLQWTANRGILNCTRQWGKSTMAAAKAVHRAYTRGGEPGAGGESDGAAERGISAEGGGDGAAAGTDGARGRGQSISLLLPNGSRIVGLPGTEGTVRGFSAVSLLLIDEAARVEDAMYKALRPMLAVGGGDLWLMSTPYGRQGFFYETWEHGGAEWKKVSVPATECARIPAAFLEEERGVLGPLWFRQEYLCEFVDSGSAVFDRELVEGALDDRVEGLEI